jgi:transposase-like protein
VAKKKQPVQSRVFTPEFKARIAKRILDGESVSGIHEEFDIKRSVLYRWRDAYEQEGAAGLDRPPGRPRGSSSRNPGSRAAKPRAGIQTSFIRRIATLERQFVEMAADMNFIKETLLRLETQRTKRTKGQKGKR